ncbi:MAG: L-2-amino-thiazoline-4-carboxylic acid hydrolase [Caldilineaceae bacterium]|nr:L-2-amino-thiazoline-4-carboxylic acid hydrolase [Caldilineaceae bacterium]
MQGNGKSAPKPDTLNEQVGVLVRREIEARILGPMIDAFADAFGRERVLEIVRSTVVEIARSQGRAMRMSGDDNDLEAFAGTMEAWKRGGALETDTLVSTGDVFDFNVTRCRYAEMYREIGMEELGSILSCARDYALIEGFNESVALARTRTIMEGASHCDFRYGLRAPVDLEA